MDSHHSEFEALYQTAPVGLGLFDRQLRCVRGNDLLAEIAGVPAEQLIGRRLADLVTPETMTRITPAYDHVLITGRAVLNIENWGELAASPHQTRWWLVSLHPYRGVGGEVLGVNTVVKDITARKARERMTAGLLEVACALSAADTVDEVVTIVIAAARSLLAAGSAVLGLVDDQGLLLHFDPVLYPHVGHWRRSDSGPVGAAARTGERVWVRSRAELRKSFPQVAQILEAHGASAIAAVPFPSVVGGPGGALAVDFSSEREFGDLEWETLTVLAACAAEAVTRARLFDAERSARERAERSEFQLSVAEQRLRLAVRAAGLVLWEVDLEGGQHWLETTAHILGHEVGPGPRLPVSQLVGRVLEADVAMVELAIERAADPSGDGVLSAEFRTAEREGRIGWHVLHGHVHFSDGDVRCPSRATGVIIDVTAEKVAEEARRLEHRDRLEREFVANASHELRTPVTVLIGAAEALQRPEVMEAPDLRARFLGHLSTETERLKRLTDSLLLLAQAEAHEGLSREVVPLRDLLAGVVAGVSPAPGVTLGIDAPDLTIETRSALLEVALGNLLRNAVRYTTSGAIYVRGRVEPHGLVIEVADTGPGMPPATLSRAVDRFFRGVPRSADGFGLGLSIAAKAAEALGARLQLESMLGIGTTARLWFPEKEG